MTVGSTGGPAAGVLARSSLFNGWSYEALTWVATRFRSRPVAPGEVICRQGDPGDEMYVVESGRFAVDAMVGGQPVRFAELGPGSVFGEIAVVMRRPRSATVTAMAPGHVWALHRMDFEQIASQQPALASAVSRLASERLAANERWQPANEPVSVMTLQPRQNAVTIGRDEHNDVVLQDPRVSRRHALLRRVGTGFRIEDLGSANGVYVNGERVSSRDLQNGDQIQIGAQVLRFDASELTRFSRGRGAQVDCVDLAKVVGKGITILNGVSLSFYPGELVAIVGGSGAGKTTLMNAISGVGPPTRGRVLYNGSDYYRHFEAYRQTLGYVPQDDIVHPDLSVYKTLYYAARLRLPSDTSGAEINQRISAVLTQLELEVRRNTEVKRLSGGQRKRVSIGVELLTEPEVFYLDEPTSGLDPGLDLRMMELLRSLADEGRTVVLTTHATRNVMLCDKVVFMARGGNLAFYGSPQDALTYFGVQDFVDIYRQLEKDGAPEEAAKKFKSSDAYRINVEQRLDASARELRGSMDGVAQTNLRGGSGKRGGPGAFLQLWWLTLRFLAVLRGDKIALAVLLAAAPVTALMLSGTLPREIFEMQMADGGNARQALSLMFMLITSSILLGGFVASRSIAEEGAIYARERLINLRIPPYVLSKAIVLGMFSVIQSLSLVAIVSGRIDIPGGNETLREIFLVVLASNIISVMAGLTASAVATNGLQAMLYVIMFMMSQMAVSGGIVPLKGMDDAAKWAADLMPARWALSLLGRAVDINTRLETQFPQNNFHDQFTVEPETCWMWLGGIFLAFLIFSVVGLKRRDVR